ncbi:hypothetical protein QX204_02185 [Nocardia sp. PE-7]|uniref:hypothetical protein n=1 Tax=Nocardia sp. PE-7 TaxID=3058426 RepID=UPI002659E3AE|nr:hypothetical protein [Nocardia sp. PE-7]WKG10331.1 hypothetical protein QX204_02185 [Nocardia sp. PE-7]
MISESDAREIASTFLDSEEFDLVEFDAGWRIVRAVQGRGATSLVVERDTAAIVSFPSSIPPQRIESSYVDVRPVGHRYDAEN